jgi:predicted amidohydrolase
MVNVVAIVVAAITAAGSCGAGMCHEYYNHVYDPSIERVTPPARPNTPVPGHTIDDHENHIIDDKALNHVKDMVMEALKQRDSDTDTEIDIKINVHNHTNHKE